MNWMDSLDIALVLGAIIVCFERILWYTRREIRARQAIKRIKEG